MSTGNKSMSFIDHLEELRWRIIKILSSIIFGGILTFFFIDFFLELLLKPLDNINSDNPINYKFYLSKECSLSNGVSLLLEVWFLQYL